mmetsp:Transcript_15281/g.18603  ORF Transcript_15281/g.18603 Transcript_15281/m.18603 type:complete len:86 (-) Transcript_15281:1346-1603(-)
MMFEKRNTQQMYLKVRLFFSFDNLFHDYLKKGDDNNPSASRIRSDFKLSRTESLAKHIFDKTSQPAPSFSFKTLTTDDQISSASQ